MRPNNKVIKLVLGVLFLVALGGGVYYLAGQYLVAKPVKTGPVMVSPAKKAASPTEDPVVLEQRKEIVKEEIKKNEKADKVDVTDSGLVPKDIEVALNGRVIFTNKTKGTIFVNFETLGGSPPMTEGQRLVWDFTKAGTYKINIAGPGFEGSVTVK